MDEKGICITGLAELPGKTILDAARLAGLLGVAQRTVRRMVERGELPRPVKFAGRACWTAERVLRRFEAAAVAADQEERKEREARLKMLA